MFHWTREALEVLKERLGFACHSEAQMQQSSDNTLMHHSLWILTFERERQ